MANTRQYLQKELKRLWFLIFSGDRIFRFLHLKNISLTVILFLNLLVQECLQQLKFRRQTGFTYTKHEGRKPTTHPCISWFSSEACSHIE